MKINNQCSLYLNDVYNYDIRACHYSIMKNYGLDLHGIDGSNKAERNILIGKMMQTNPRLTSFLRNTTSAIVYEFISECKIKEEDLLMIQYDGIIVKKILRKISSDIMTLELRAHFQTLIMSINRNSYIAYDVTNNKAVIKGVSHRYKKMDEILGKLVKIEFQRKRGLFRQLQKIKDNFMTSTDIHLFCIPLSDDKYSVFLKGYGELEIAKQTIKIMDPNDIDKHRYFDFYLRPFTQSIVAEHVRQ